MKRIILLLMISLAPLITFSQGLRALYSFYTFNIPSKKPYVEIITSIDKASISYKDNNDGAVELTLVIKKDSSIIYAEKRELKTSSLQSGNSIIDIQRIELDNSQYSFNINIKDKNSSLPALKIEDYFEIKYPKNEINVSSIQLIDSYKKTSEQNINTKNGIELIPYLFDAVSEERNEISYYAELYNADKQFGKDNYYIISVALEEFKTGKKIENKQIIKREKARVISVALGTLNISDLPQGMYNLVIEARDGNNILYAYNKTYFYRYSKTIQPKTIPLPQESFVNTIAQKDIDENINCLFPILSEIEKAYIKRNFKTMSYEDKKFFLFNFWRTTNQQDPEGEWKKYMNEVAYVNEKYSTNIKKGYQTDMGRVYLVYGKPDILIDEKFKVSSGVRSRSIADQVGNPDAQNTKIGSFAYMPYQIWRYNATPFGERNKGFVFYAPQNNLMEYILLHSDAKGEPYDYYWESRLTRESMPEGVEGDAAIQFRRGY